MMRGFVWEGGWARVLVLAACLAGGTARAAPSFRVDKNYPEVGLRFRTLGNSVPEPLAQPKTHTYTFTRGEEQMLLQENESVYLPLGCVHRLENPGKLPLNLIEVQSGSYLGEDDIVRIEDAFGRA